MSPSAVRGRFPALSPDEVALLRAWIDQGAEWPAGVLLTPLITYFPHVSPAVSRNFATAIDIES
jgi:hypothetical protein